MAYKTLGIRVGTYDRLKDLKNPGESFSDLFERLIQNETQKGNLRAIIGSISKEDGAELKRIVIENRNKSRLTRI